MKYYTISQNNSGGEFDHEPRYGIGYCVCVQAENLEHAGVRLEEILNYPGRGGDCFCCGPRWDFWIDESDGCDYPSKYSGKPLKGGWGIPSYIHYANGSIVGVPA